jgi:hypothetical protein
MDLPNVVVVLGRCSRSRQSFGVRLEEKERGHWLADWAFRVAETLAKKEGYDRREITGVFDFDPAYPGCPSCRSPSLFVCHCGKVFCWDGERRAVTCAWCGAALLYHGPIHRLSAGGDR